MPAHAPGVAGVLAVVKVTGPALRRSPLTVRPTPSAIRMVVPGATVITTPASMLTSAVAVMMPGPQVPSLVWGETMMLPSGWSSARTVRGPQAKSKARSRVDANVSVITVRRDLFFILTFPLPPYVFTLLLSVVRDIVEAGYNIPDAIKII